MTTTRSSGGLVRLGVVITACAAPRPTTHPNADVVGVSTGPRAPLASRPPAAAAGEEGDAPYRQWTEIARGLGNGHALSDVQITTATVLVSNERAKVHYCDGGALEQGATFGVAEAMVLADERRLYYIIERSKDGTFRYLVHADGETNAASELCATCHERDRQSPFFRAHRATGCR